MIAQFPVSSLATGFRLPASGNIFGNFEFKLEAGIRKPVASSKPAAGSWKPEAAPMSIPREHRLRKHAEFELVYKSGRRHFSSSLTAFYLLHSGTENLVPRVGITVGRQLGGAVRRNRIKRRVRAAVARNVERLSCAVDVVINPKKIVGEMDFEMLCAEVARAFDVIGQKSATTQEPGRLQASSAAKRQA